MDTIFETPRLRVRPWRESDAEVLFRYASEPEVGERAGWPPHESIEDSIKVIRGGCRDWLLDREAVLEPGPWDGGSPGDGRLVFQQNGILYALERLLR